MRKAMMAALMAAALVPGLAQAQNHELRDDRHDIREQQRELRHDYRRGASWDEVRDDRRDLRDARAEYRDDWREYRRSHPDVYRAPRWVGPRGFIHRDIRVGYRFRPEYYDRRYWIDPYRYHLHPVSGAQRWVRYGPDVVLIDIRSGRVLEINRGFFF